MAEGPSTTLCDYLTSLPISWKIKQEINTDLNSELTGDLKDLNRLAYERVEPILSIFENGNYGIFYSSHFENSRLVFPPTIKKQLDKDKFLSDWQKIQSDNPKFSIDTLLVEPYDDYYPIIATQNEIEEERVDFYTNQIKEGKRPSAIVFCSYHDNYIRNVNIDKSITLTGDLVFSDFYAIDGHHKLLAYKRAGISPSIIFIAHLPKNLAEVEPSFEEVFKRVQPYHFASMVRYIKPTDTIATRIMNSQNKLLKKYLKKYSHYYNK